MIRPFDSDIAFQTGINAGDIVVGSPITGNFPLFHSLRADSDLSKLDSVWDSGTFSGDSYLYLQPDAHSIYQRTLPTGIFSTFDAESIVYWNEDKGNWMRMIIRRSSKSIQSDDVITDQSIGDNVRLFLTNRSVRIVYPSYDSDTSTISYTNWPYSTQTEYPHSKTFTVFGKQEKRYIFFQNSATQFADSFSNGLDSAIIHYLAEMSPYEVSGDSTEYYKFSMIWPIVKDPSTLPVGVDSAADVSRTIFSTLSDFVRDSADFDFSEYTFENDAPSKPILAQLISTALDSVDYLEGSTLEQFDSALDSMLAAGYTAKQLTRTVARDVIDSNSTLFNKFYKYNDHFLPEKTFAQFERNAIPLDIYADSSYDSYQDRLVDGGYYRPLSFLQTVDSYASDYLIVLDSV